MFELGWIEIALIGVIALVVLGPERLPKAARFTGLWVRKARAQWFAVKAELEREIAADGLKAGLEAEARVLREAAADLRKTSAELREDFEAPPAAVPPPAGFEAPPAAAPPAAAPPERPGP
ncbi:Sec-independent protein translocase protein TatB [Silanimonas sp.]|uniref:Sec-independent protein translocase protein TatB n=1 Tax=Silanimonas sp. TaxID=1929290 RepID=UPI001BC22AE5|nr:Sec-independent protein translocase protein TatB [Silanimonas sp.]MBS3896723.1 twin-arginine translocase subunit TatB [Silanimonas sp.]MBS3924615.1 twin-arginine translocase subunit TatB [Xanthomonadaceae bacterium]MBS3925005.1 twin-arginine translocase subunit TatB [Xanthomonadaceae bacterium]